MQYKKTTLKNGLRIITIPMKNTKTVTVLVEVGTGSRYENENEAGISHFLEHMFFKGTQKRPTTLDIAEEMDSIGGEYNAFTYKEKTGYWAKVDASHWEKALDVVADIYLNSKLDQEEIDREKGTIIQELNMYEDMPTANIYDVFESLIYPNNSLGKEIIGTKESISGFQRENFVDYMNRHYVSNSTVVAVAGNFNEKKVLKKIQEYFSSMKKGKRAKFEKFISQKQSSPAVKIKNKKTDQTHFSLGVRTFDFNHPDRFALGLLAVILGGNMSSRLFIEVRERRGLAYRISTATESYADAGYLTTNAGVEHKNLELALKTILEEYGKISSEKIEEKELRKAKDFVKGKAVMDFESSDEVASFFIDQEVRKGKIMTLEQIFAKIEAVKSAEILRLAQKIFSQNNLSLAVIGPHKNESELKNILRKYSRK